MAFYNIPRKTIKADEKPWGVPDIGPPPPPEIGDIIDGDIVFAQWAEPSTGDLYWLLAAPAIKRILAIWGFSGKNTGLPNMSSSTVDPNCGSYNTDVLMSPGNIDYNNGQGSPAAKHCRSLSTKYFLPNHDQLNLIAQNRGLIDVADVSGGTNTLAAITASPEGPVPGYCWSSTSLAVSDAFAQKFNYGRGSANKGNPLWVLPIRRIKVTA